MKQNLLKNMLTKKFKTYIVILLYLSLVKIILPPLIPSTFLTALASADTVTPGPEQTFGSIFGIFFELLATALADQKTRTQQKGTYRQQSPANPDDKTASRTLPSPIEPISETAENNLIDLVTPVTYNSGVGVVDGSLKLTHTLVPTKVMNSPHSLTFFYTSSSAYPATIVKLNLKPSSLNSSPLGVLLCFDSLYDPLLYTIRTQRDKNYTFYKTFFLTPSFVSSVKIARARKCEKIKDGTYVCPTYEEDTKYCRENGTTIPIDVHYRDKVNSPFGAGWALEGLQKIVRYYSSNENTGKRFIVSLDDGYGTLKTFSFFAPVGSKEYDFYYKEPIRLKSPDGDYSTLQKLSGGIELPGEFLRTMRDGTKITFTSDGLMISSITRNGSATAFCYDSDKRITKIGLFAPETFSSESYSTYCATPQSSQAQTTAALAEYIFKYETINSTTQKVTIINPAKRPTTLTLDLVTNNSPSFRVLKNIQDPDGAETKFKYFADATTNSEPSSKRLITEVTNPNGNISKYEYYNQRRNGLPIPIDRVEYYIAKDKTGTIKEKRRFIPSALTLLSPRVESTTGGYLSENMQDSKIIYNEDKSEYTYTESFSIGDPKGCLTSITGAQGRTTKYSDFDSNCNAKTTTENNGVIIKKTYYEEEPKKGLLKSTNEFNVLASLPTSYTYNDFGQLLTTTDPLIYDTENRYYNNGNLWETEDTNDRKTIYYYTKGFLTSTIDHLKRLTVYEYNNPMSNLSKIQTAMGFPTTFANSDAAGNPQTIIDANGKETKFTYDLANRVKTVTDARGYTTKFDYDKNGNRTSVTSVTDTNSYTTTFEYDYADRLTKVTRPDNKFKEFTYNPNGDLEKITDFKKQTIEFKYKDPYGNLKPHEVRQKILKNSTGTTEDTINYDYDTGGRLTNMTGEYSNIQKHYDDADRLDSEISNSGRSPNVEPNGETIQPFTVEYFYKDTTSNIDTNKLEKTTFKMLPDNDTIVAVLATDDYSYYYAINRLNAVSSFNFISGTPSSLVRLPGFANFVYDNADRLDFVTYDFDTAPIPNSSLDYRYQSYYYNDDNRLTALASGRKLISSAEKIYLTEIYNTYTPDNLGNVVASENFEVDGNIYKSDTNNLYSLDRLYRLEETQHWYPKLHPGSSPPTPSKSFHYDPLGNRTSRYDIFSKENYKYDPTDKSLNRLSSIDDNVFYYYDDNGNLIEKIDGYEDEYVKYFYDVEDKLIKVEKYDLVYKPILTAKYFYDVLARRIMKVIDFYDENKNLIPEKKKVIKYLYDGDDIVFELDKDNKVMARYIHSLDVDTPLAMLRDTNKNGKFDNDEVFFYHRDHLGSTVYLGDRYGNPERNIIIYDAFGKIVKIKCADFDRGVYLVYEDELLPKAFEPDSFCIPNPFTYTGREFDDETGLYYYRARYYDPTIGRFIQEDPEWAVNPYPYVGNNPVNYTDPYGAIMQEIILMTALIAYDTLEKEKSEALKEKTKIEKAKEDAALKTWDPYLKKDVWSGAAPVTTHPVDIAIAIASGISGVAKFGAALRIEINAFSKGNVFKIISKELKMGFRIDKAHHGKPWGHSKFWKW